MDTTKLREVIADFRAEAAELVRLADDLEKRLKRSGSSAAAASPASHRQVFHSKHKGAKKSYLTLAVEVLREHGQPMHVKDLVPMVAEKRGADVSRANVEGALVRGMAKGSLSKLIKRTAPGTFTVSQ